MYVSLFVKISWFWSYLTLKIGKKAKNARGVHIHDTTAFLGGLQKIEKNSGVLMESPGIHLDD